MENFLNTNSKVQSAYQTPEIHVTELHGEGVLCLSVPGASNEGWGAEDIS